MGVQFGAPPETLLVLGSGLGGVVDRMDIESAATTQDLGLPQSRVKGHAGQVLCGSIGGRRIGVLSGRVHLYEGHPAPLPQPGALCGAFR